MVKFVVLVTPMRLKWGWGVVSGIKEPTAVESLLQLLILQRDTLVEVSNTIGVVQLVLNWSLRYMIPFAKLANGRVVPLACWSQTLPWTRRQNCHSSSLCHCSSNDQG
jgi:hypothetical protein